MHWPVIEAVGFSATYTAAELRVSRPRRLSMISILITFLSSNARMSILILYQLLPSQVTPIQHFVSISGFLENAKYPPVDPLLLALCSIM